MMQGQFEIILAGAGGQGLILAGTVLGEAAVHAGLNASCAQSYGVASRGGASRAEVVVSAGDIAFPMVRRPDAVLALTQAAYDAQCTRLAPGGVALIDSGAVHGGAGTWREVALPIVEEAHRLKSPGNTNLVALGALVALTAVIPHQALEDVISQRFSSHSAAAAALGALRAGRDLAAADAAGGARA
jgi:2-oxoglutarate ferredoxin oxidoreductase subunit gamma